MAPRSAADEPVARPVDRGDRGGRAVRPDTRAGQGPPIRQSDAPLMDDLRERRCGAPDPDHTGRGGDHRRGDRLLDHDRHADARLDPVRATDAAQLHPRPWHAVHPGHVCRDVRIRDASPDHDWPGQRGKGLRPASFDHGRGRPGDALDGDPDLLHKPHRNFDSAAAGDRKHRSGSLSSDRRRVRRSRRRCRIRAVGARTAAAHDRRRWDRSGALERLPAVRPPRDADRTGRREGRRDPPSPQTRSLRRRRLPDGGRLAPRCHRRRQPSVAPRAHHRP